MCEEMRTLVSRFAEYLRRSERQLQCFHQYESQVEGWFKGELICFLDQEKLAGRLPNFEREKLVRVGDERNRIQVDMMLQFDPPGSVVWVELKHWIKTQNNINYYRNDWYFTTPSTNCSSCVQHGVEKLMKIDGEDGAKFMLVLCTDNPSSNVWNSGVEKFNKSSPRAVRPLTNPDDYPDYFFLGLLHVCPKIEGPK